MVHVAFFKETLIVRHTIKITLAQTALTNIIFRSLQENAGKLAVYANLTTKGMEIAYSAIQDIPYNKEDA